jgi:hypothetical protein
MVAARHQARLILIAVVTRSSATSGVVSLVLSVSTEADRVAEPGGVELGRQLGRVPTGCGGEHAGAPQVGHVVPFVCCSKSHRHW